MVCEKHILDKLMLLDKNLIYFVEKSYTFVENEDNPEDCTILHVTFKNPSIFISRLEEDDKRNNYFINKNRSDALLFERVAENKYKIHILEFKKKVKTKTWCSIKDQFVGSLLEAIVWGSFLGFDFSLDDARLYTCYRIDAIKEALDSSPIEIRRFVGESAKEINALDWNEANLNVEIISLRKIQHTKVQLDTASGIGNITI